jgi:T3SS negative regulator,GrlR
MIEGFWIVQFEGLSGSGAGVVTFIKGRVFGGDGGSTYIGDYQVDAKEMKARVRIHNYMPGIVSVIGMQGDYDLEVTGTIEGDVIRASGSPVGHQVAGLSAQLTRVAKLPE